MVLGDLSEPCPSRPGRLKRVMNLFPIPSDSVHGTSKSEANARRGDLGL